MLLVLLNERVKISDVTKLVIVTNRFREPNERPPVPQQRTSPEQTPDLAATTGAGERIRAARLARAMTQADLALAVGVSRSAVAQWETDRAGQVRANLVGIAEALGVSVGHLVVGPVGASLPEAAPVDSAELALLRLYRSCSAADRQLLLQTAVRLSRANS